MRTEDQAVRVAERIGYPVVVKPLDGNHGRGVCLDLAERAATSARRSRSPRSSPVAAWVIVESFVTGKDYRCLVIDGRIAAIAERVPASVTGDGTSTVEQLVDLTNADPRRGVGHEKVLTRIKVDAAAEEVLAAQGHALDSTSRPRARWSSWRSPATCRPAASRSTAPSRRTRRTSRSPRRRPG